MPPVPAQPGLTDPDVRRDLSLAKYRNPQRRGGRRRGRSERDGQPGMRTTAKGMRIRGIPRCFGYWSSATSASGSANSDFCPRVHSPRGAPSPPVHVRRGVAPSAIFRDGTSASRAACRPCAGPRWNTVLGTLGPDRSYEALSEHCILRKIRSAVQNIWAGRSPRQTGASLSSVIVAIVSGVDRPVLRNSVALRSRFVCPTTSQE